METKQRLTLGVAAILIVTLTIVGVTYAYFVTRVTGDLTESISVQTANIGSVKYQPGNGTTDTITLTGVMPGDVIYKTFSVYNDSEGSGADYVSNYDVYLTSTPLENKAQFVHAESDAGCYVSAVSPSNTKDNDATAEVTEGPTSTCFDGENYNNVLVTLYQLTETGYATVNAGIKDDGSLNVPEGTTEEAFATTLFSTTNAKAVVTNKNVPAVKGVEIGTASADLTTNPVTINGKETIYYVLKVEYKNLHSNQNIENEAALSIKVSIK